MPGGLHVVHISHLTIRNFRALSEVDCDLSPRMNVIVGPNAIGKTTILQALRLAKGTLAPRSQNESMQVLISLGAASPHFPQRLLLNSIPRDPNVQTEIRSTYILTDSEINILKSSVPEFVRALVGARAGQTFVGPTALLQFLDSTQGIKLQQEAAVEINDAIQRMEIHKRVMLGLNISGTTGQLHQIDQLAGPIISFLEQRLHPTVSYFSYFPADRALPVGETTMQIGSQDSILQMESHNSQPHLKYQRLKNLIVNSVVLKGTTEDDVRVDFEKIFGKLLRGRTIDTINVNEIGLLSVMTKELSTGRLIDIDSLSSGEKNVALTFLIVARSLARGGIALFDEPELHLNPSVSRDLMSFIMDEYAFGRDIQFIMCTHSPEILSSAFREPECKLLHLKSPTDLTPIGKQSSEEYAMALHKLGASVGEALLYEGTIFVEGEGDVSFIEAGFPDLNRKYKIKEMGGRREIEKAIDDLQSLERAGLSVSPVYLIFDKDNVPSKLTNSKTVRFLQWSRYCVENYMIDIDVLAELLKDSTVTKSPIASAGDVYRMCRDLALNQIIAIAARDVYVSYQYLSPSLRREDTSGKTCEDIADALFERMSAARGSVPTIDKPDWTAEFVAATKRREAQLRIIWEDNWKETCDGKKLISDLHRAASLKLSIDSFKDRIVTGMRENRSENWVLTKGLLDGLLE
jgi:predicted ATPase